MSFDPKCYELAEHFLPPGATQRLLNELAQHIQTSIEDWLDCNCKFGELTADAKAEEPSS